LCEAAGFDTIFVETVGVGQSETAVHSMVDFFLFLQVAGTGDELQGIKRGIMEMADGIAINKADGSNVDRVNLTKAQLISALHLFPLPESGWSPKVLTCSALNNVNIDSVWTMISEFIDFVKQSHYFEHKRLKQSKYWMYESINDQLKSHFYNNEKVEALLPEYEEKVINNKISSFIAAKELLDGYFGR
jgi:LAO/AO transport system kinase